LFSLRTLLAALIFAFGLGACLLPGACGSKRREPFIGEFTETRALA